MSPKENLIELLRELFQLNNSDLDFGIYRILKLRSRDVEEFIDYVLPKKLEEVKKKLEDRAADDIKKELENVTTDLKANYGDDFETKTDALGQIALFKEKYGQYKLLRQNLENSRLSEDIENDIYNDLYRFFERYYEEGDFVTKPRAGDKTYMIPYDGEEVKLYWANYDQYYIKTGENFKNYVFTNGNEDDKKITVEFRIKDVETSVNNNQNEKGRLFVPTEEYFEWNEEEKKLSIYFYYKKPTDKEKDDWGNKQSVKKDNKGINEQLIIRLEKKIKGTKNKDLIEFYYKEREDKKLFYYHLNRYTALNKFDYFIHKDLKKFLTRELDYYLKNEILSISFLNPEWKDEDVEQGIKLNVVKASAIRELAYTIIEFLDELENFQRRLYEKKKFVVQNEYIMTLNMVPEETFDDVINDILEDEEKKQIKEWQNLNFEVKNKISKSFIKKNLELVIDTGNLRAETKNKILNSIVKIDANVLGLLINSENFQSINLIINKFNQKIAFNYIDPPYNTKEDDFAYKDKLKTSSWLTMMVDRTKKAKELMKDRSINFYSIDDNEFSTYKKVLNEVWGNQNYISELVWDLGTGTAAGHFTRAHEYILVYAKSKAKYPNFSYNGDTSLISERAVKKITTANPRSAIEFPAGIDFECEDKEFPNEFGTTEKIYITKGRMICKNKKLAEDVTIEAGWAMRNQIINWLKGEETYDTKGQRVTRFYFNEKGVLQYEKERGVINPPSVIRQVASTRKGSKLLEDILGYSVPIYPKPVELVQYLLELGTDKEDYVIDYFAGSGTTGHAIIKQNKDDQGFRKFILMEMGGYFETVMLQRLKKILYAAEWNNGVPKNKQKLDGYSSILNYVKLEQYEDTLNNIVFDENDLELEFEDKIKYRFRGGAENSASIMLVDKFEDPFNYQMEILQQNERKLQPVDLVTTFNFLLGIDIDKIKTEEHQSRTYRIITGQRKEQGYFIVWRKYDDKLKLDEERDWIKELDYYDENYKKYCNADNSFGAESTENEFKRLMFEDVN